MAKIYNFHIYSDKTESENIMEFENSKIKIANEFGEQTRSQLKEIFKGNSKVAIANNVEPPGEMGGGGLGTFPLMDLLHFGLIITVLITTRGFFDELGRELAKKLLSVLFEKDRPTELIIESREKIIEIIIPSKTKLENIKNVQDFLENFDKLQGGKCVYSSDTKSFVFISKYKRFKSKE
jgi:hypothetical protein